jgi:hypothetical protein
MIVRNIFTWLFHDFHWPIFNGFLTFPCIFAPHSRTRPFCRTICTIFDTRSPLERWVFHFLSEKFSPIIKREGKIVYVENSDTDFTAGSCRILDFPYNFLYLHENIYYESVHLAVREMLYPMFLILRNSGRFCPSVCILLHWQIMRILVYNQLHTGWGNLNFVFQESKLNCLSFQPFF